MSPVAKNPSPSPLECRVIIMRGIPGAGKSTYVKTLQAPDTALVVCSADDVFTDAKGVYRFDPKRLPEAHARCLKRFLETIRHFEDGEKPSMVTPSSCWWWTTPTSEP